jgi:NAD(P)-dependent dehydrogenase (short-subunit alcohol dehydrogenase family)
MHVLRESSKLTSSQPSGPIVVSASVCALQGSSEQATSSSTNQHGAIGLVQCAAKDVELPRIRVDCVAPGMNDTA